MDPTQPPSSDNQPTPVSAPVAFGSSVSGAPEPPPKYRKKIFIAGGIIITLIFFVGVGFYVWTVQNRNAQLAQQAKITLAQKAKDAQEAKARKGTINDLNLSLGAELKTIQEINDRTTYNLSDRIKQEVEEASSIGTGNENGL